MCQCLPEEESEISQQGASGQLVVDDSEHDETDIGNFQFSAEIISALRDICVAKFNVS